MANDGQPGEYTTPPGYTGPEYSTPPLPPPAPSPPPAPAPAPPAYPPSAPPSYPTSAPPGYPTSAPPGYPTSAPPGYPTSAPPGYPTSAPPGYPPPGYPTSAPPGYPQPGYAGAPVAATPTKRRWPIVVLVVVLVFGLACCGGGYFVYDKIRDAVTGGTDEPLGSPGTNGLPTDPTDTAFAKVGDCVVDKPTADEPENMAIAPCSSAGAYKVNSRYNGTADGDQCPEEDVWYTHDDDEDSSRNYTLCLTEL